MQIAIYGAGAMGTVLGAFLCRAGISVDLVSRDEAHIAALKTAGAKIGGTVSFSTPPFNGTDGQGSAMLPSEMNKKYDVIFLLTKQTDCMRVRQKPGETNTLPKQPEADNAATAETLKNHLTPAGILCTMQNGIPEPALAAILGEDKVTGCICIWGATKTAPGVAELTSKPGSMRFVLDNRGSILQPVLQKICPVTIERNFTGARWSKLLINAAFSGISAVTGLSFGEIAACRRLNHYVLHIIKECVEVCRASGIAIEPVQGKFPAEFLYFKSPIKQFLLSKIMPVVMRNHRSIKSGMLRDLSLNRTCEIESINGVVCRTGREHNVPTPYNDRIVQIVHSIENGDLRCDPQGEELFRDGIL